MKLDFSSLQTTAPLFGGSSELPGGFSAPPSFQVPVTDDFDGFQKEAIQMVKPAKGTTTLAFIFKDGVIVAADSRASMGGYIVMLYPLCFSVGIWNMNLVIYVYNVIVSMFLQHPNL
ncbi:hypothetical protein M0R45_021549 [Rubus argutus]|uniref:Uncharacterized protein n=1 Tax=Rubus argutus TaxID=59490 RepID=A0AAW1XBM4_RUBAR